MSSIIIKRELCWEKVCEFYWDNIHWNQPADAQLRSRLREWLEDEWGARLTDNFRDLVFKTEESATIFMLRWC